MLEVRQANGGRIYTKPQDSANGSFTYPRAYPIKFRETSQLNITWNTKYSAVNLFCYQRGKVATPMQLSTNLAEKWFQWDVKVLETNLTEPYVFRIVNAKGTSQEQSNGGFWSSSFSIVRDTRDHPPTTSDASLSEATPSETPAVEPSSSLGSGAIAGIAVGAVAGVALLVFLAFWFGKRRRSKSEQQQYVAAPSYTAYEDDTHKRRDGSADGQMAQVVHAQPTELQGGSSAPSNANSWYGGSDHKPGGTAHLPQGQPNELAGDHPMAYELPGNTR
ncbi:hypothetical protein PG990_004126 [Apiospora arundinis]